jgi:hypothetical protein
VCVSNKTLDIFDALLVKEVWSTKLEDNRR